MIIVSSCSQIVVISGSSEAVRSAGESVRECVRRRMEESEAQVVAVSVPQYAIGRLIGRGGANIRSIQRESGAKVSLKGCVLVCVVLCDVTGVSAEREWRGGGECGVCGEWECGGD